MPSEPRFRPRSCDETSFLGSLTAKYPAELVYAAGGRISTLTLKVLDSPGFLGARFTGVGKCSSIRPSGRICGEVTTIRNLIASVKRIVDDTVAIAFLAHRSERFGGRKGGRGKRSVYQVIRGCMPNVIARCLTGGIACSCDYGADEYPDTQRGQYLAPVSGGGGGDGAPVWVSLVTPILTLPSYAKGRQ